MTDQRPIYSPMPEALARLYDRHGPDVQRVVSQVFAEAMAIADGRPRAELVNDALSLQAQVAALAGIQFVLTLVDNKPGVGLELAADIAIGDVVARMRHGIDLLVAAREAQTAVRQ